MIERPKEIMNRQIINAVVENMKDQDMFDLLVSGVQPQSWMQSSDDDVVWQGFLNFIQVDDDQESARDEIDAWLGTKLGWISQDTQ
jgi:hypothetical protein